MKVLVTGATGFVGRRLCEALQTADHSVCVLSRDPAAATKTLPTIDKAFAWDPFTEVPPAECFEGVETVVHLAGESVVGRWNTAKKKAIRESRVLGTRHLVEGLAASNSPPSTLISASAIGFYGDRGDEILEESSAGGSDFLADVCRGWEEESMQAMATGVRVALLRIGVVLGTEGGALQAMLRPFKLGLGGPMGNGQQWWSWIHVEDLVRIVLFILDTPGLEGALNAAAPEPIRQKDFARELGNALGRPALIPTPGFAVRLALGEFSVELLSSKRVIPARLRSEGFRFSFPDLRAALENLFSS